MENNIESDAWTYKMKCRGCDKITEMWFGLKSDITKYDFQAWANEHSTFPFHHQCTCDNGSILIHDLVSYTIATI